MTRNQPHLPRLLLLLVVVGTTAVSLWSRTTVPLRVEASLTHDDLLFARLAGFLVDGRWLGPFDSLTLAKGPGYPMFVAAVHTAEIPLKLAEQSAHILAAGLLALGAGRFTGRPGLGVAIFVFVALDPSQLSSEAARLNRTALYASASTALLGSVLLAASFGRRRLSLSSVPALVLTGFGLGFAWLACVLTREERVTLLPIALAGALAALWAAGVRGRTRTWQDRRKILLRLAPVLAVVVLAAPVVAVGQTLVEQRNEREYGLAAVTDFVDGAFPDLYGALAAIEVGTPRRYVPITAAQRAAAYAASPTMARLRPELEGDWGQRWIVPGCDAVRVCDDVAAGWMPWALRGAVLRTLGEQRTAPAVQALMKRAAEEVKAACGEAYPCREVSGFVPDPGSVPLGDLLRATVNTTVQVLRYDVPAYDGPAGSLERHRAFADVVIGLSADPAALAADVRAQGPWADRQRTLYSWVTGLALLPALVGLLWARDRGQRPLQVLACVLAVAAASRLALVALVDVTSFPAVGTGYALPAVAPAMALLVVGCTNLVLIVRQRRSATGACA